jgi:hypothetical protein
LGGARFPILGGREPGRRSAGDRLGSFLPLGRRSERPDRERCRRQARGLSHRQRHRAPGNQPVQPRNGFTYIRGNRNPDGTCCIPLPDFANAFISAGREFWYDALLVSVDKPYTASSKWGATIAYTYAQSEQTGNDLFSLDCQPAECRGGIDDFPRHPTANDERHRLVFSGILGLPWEIRFSTLITLGSGLPWTINDAFRGFGPNEFRVRLNEGRQEGSFPFDPAYQSWDFRLQKDFLIANLVSVGLIGEVFNATNHSNFTDFEGFIRIANDPAGPNPDFGKPRQVSTPGRRFQFGVNVSF